jgi:hypothetical protein
MAEVRVKLTPPINTTGRYLVAAPFDAIITANEIYECVAIRQFDEIEQLGQSVLERYYTPFGLSNQIFGEDERAGANIITLATISGQYYFIPDTYILEFPNMGDVTYRRVILSVDLGPIPSSLDLTFLRQQIASVVTDVTGLTDNREPAVYMAVAPTRGAVTPQEHEIMEATRLASIANRTTDRAKLIVLEQQNAALVARSAFLEQYILELQNSSPP